MLEVAIFSYNRVDFLRNALESVRRNMPDVKVSVYDDNSDDPAMLDYLKTISEYVLPVPKQDNRRHGGLYFNMQLAYEGATEPYLMMMQDDTQVVRPLNGSDYAQIEGLYESDPERAFVSPLFIKGRRIRRYRRQLAPEENGLGYGTPDTISEKNYARRLSYFDISIAHLERLRAKNWSYLNSEDENCIQARKLYSNIAVMRDPMMFFCPEVPFFRNRVQTKAARMAMERNKGLPAFFNDMTEREVAQLKARSIDQWPVAEDWLKTTRKVKRPFVFKDVQATWWLYAAHKLEQKLRG